MRTFDGRYQIPRYGRQGITYGYWRKRGVSSTLKSPRDDIPRVTMDSSSTSDKSELEGGPAAAGGRVWQRYQGIPGLGPPPPQGSMSPDEGVLQGRGLLHTTARSSNPQAYHGGAGRAVSLRTTPGVENPHIRQSFPSG